MSPENKQNTSVNESVKILVRCHCGYEWNMDAGNIPQGETYETTCPKCGALLKRKHL